MGRPRCGESLLVAEYKGTYDLDLKNFPFVSNEDETISNILTRYMTVGDKDSPEYLLYPSMHKGEMLDDPEKSALEGKHFGKYSSEIETRLSDQYIHSVFGGLEKIMPQVTESDATMVDIFGDKSQSSDNVKGFLKALIGN